MMLFFTKVRMESPLMSVNKIIINLTQKMAARSRSWFAIFKAQITPAKQDVCEHTR